MVTALLALTTLEEVRSFNVEGVRREALVFESHTQNAPIVFAFHGHGGTMRSASRSFRVQELWPEATVVYPQGLPTAGRTDPKGDKPGWQKKPRELNDRDIKLFDAILSSLAPKRGTKVFVMGHSNGGAMSFTLWAARADKITAYGPSGSPALHVLGELRPAPVFYTAGEKDQIVSYRMEALSMQALARLDRVDLGAAKLDGFVRQAVGSTGIPFGTYVHPGGHEYPFAAAKATVDFFKLIAAKP